MQQAKKLKVKPLITYGNGINESLKLEKVPTPPFHFRMERYTDLVSGISAQTWGLSHC